MEACSSAHHWARRFIGIGIEVRLISPQHVREIAELAGVRSMVALPTTAASDSGFARANLDVETSPPSCGRS